MLLKMLCFLKSPAPENVLASANSLTLKTHLLKATFAAANILVDCGESQVSCAEGCNR
jgi:hypothetical protein